MAPDAGRPIRAVSNRDPSTRAIHEIDLASPSGLSYDEKLIGESESNHEFCVDIVRHPEASSQAFERARRKRRVGTGDDLERD